MGWDTRLEDRLAEANGEPYRLARGPRRAQAGASLPMSPDTSRCQCEACGPSRCEGVADFPAVGVEATLNLCARCYQTHRRDALITEEQDG